jgi:hypothetical protein
VPIRQYSLARLLAFVTAIGLLCGVIAVILRYAGWNSIPAAIGGQLLGAVLFAIALGLLFGNVRRAIVAGLLSAFLAQIVWNAILRLLDTSIDVDDVLYNPLILIVAVACSVACARNRFRATLTAALASIFVPTAVAAYLIIQLPKGLGVRGTGLATVIIVITSCAAILTGIGSAFLTAIFCAVYDDAQSRRSSEPSERSAGSPDNSPP